MLLKKKSPSKDQEPRLMCATYLLACILLCDSMDVMEPSRLLGLWDSPDRNSRVDCHSLLQGTFLTRGSPSLAGRLFTTVPPGSPGLQMKRSNEAKVKQTRKVPHVWLPLRFPVLSC